MEKLPLTIVPSSTVKLPVAGKEIRVRAMNIREEKNLLTAKDAGNTDDILFCINELVKACTYGKLDFENLSIPDVTALFLKIVELSKGPTCVHTYICHNKVDGEDCLGQIEVEVDLRNVKFIGIFEISQLPFMPRHVKAIVIRLPIFAELSVKRAAKARPVFRLIFSLILFFALSLTFHHCEFPASPSVSLPCSSKRPATSGKGFRLRFRIPFI